MRWYTNTLATTLDFPGLRDVSGQPLRWTPAGTPLSRRCIDAGVAAHPQVARFLGWALVPFGEPLTPVPAAPTPVAPATAASAAPAEAVAVAATAEQEPPTNASSSESASADSDGAQGDSEDPATSEESPADAATPAAADSSFRKKKRR